MLKHVNITVFGQVQGVSFRQAIKDKAQELAVMGFVRNEPNGSVFIEAEGPEKKLQQLIKWCRLGPAAAQVKECRVVPAPLKEYASFEIHY